MFRIIAPLICGIAIGLNVGSILNKKGRKLDKDIIKNLEGIVQLYEQCEEEYRKVIDYWKVGMYETLEQNINLRRRLNNKINSKS